MTTAQGPARGILDTSVFIASESGRAIEASLLPDLSAVSVVTVAELRAGVLIAEGVDVRARRLTTLEAALGMAPLAVDDAVAQQWARLRLHLLHAGRRMKVNDLWIAATAVAHQVPVVTQDGDFESLDGAEGFARVRV